MADNTTSTNQLAGDGHRNPPPTHRHLITYSRKRKHFRFQVNPSTELNPISDSSVLGLVLLAHTFTYDLRNLPESLLLEILSRLPLQSIFRFKCVCKQWRSLISQPSFCRFYFTANAASSSIPFRILYRYIYVSKFKDILDRFRPDTYNSSKFSVLFLSSFEEQQQSDQFKILAVSNGLILCCLLGPLIYYICDPVTRQWITLPRGRDKYPNRHPIFFGEGLVSRVNEDNVLTSYTVVRVELLNSLSTYLNLEMFSSETGKWVFYRLPCTNPIALLKRGGGPISYNGILHWFVYNHGMVAFDPHKDPKSCRLIQFPVDRDVESEYKHDGLYRLCGECQGRLRFFEVAPEPFSFYVFSMWDLKDYEKGEWVSEFKVTRSDLSSSDPELGTWLTTAAFLPLSFHPFNLDIVYLRCVELACIVSYNIRDKRLDVACETIGVVEDLSWRVVVPFVIPRWPTPVPIPPGLKKAVKPKLAHRHRSYKIYQRF
ncbi:F-box protein At1g49990-like isoform X1 [Cynara cardunculus var. scolymus]|uniref:F-box domain-containing protein n=1 Tax=Cynara cardunculus var. scolymus TaxID=59895 RepID=A0A118K194_CYNCS|nr:F-box protein At1g49990-like isoform X1 [Cynara cardunculus var. scolymus]KVI02473.1 protein of unknown function DUF1618 [Cynara cardunculus var. scolymus]